MFRSVALNGARTRVLARARERRQAKHMREVRGDNESTFRGDVNNRRYKVNDTPIYVQNDRERTFSEAAWDHPRARSQSFHVVIDNCCYMVKGSQNKCTGVKREGIPRSCYKYIVRIKL